MLDHKKEIPTNFATYVVDPLQAYAQSLTSPDPAEEIRLVVQKVRLLYTIPGWAPETIEYIKGRYRVSERSAGVKSAILLAWARYNQWTMQVLTDGFYLNFTETNLPARPLVLPEPPPSPSFYPPSLNVIVSTIVDNVGKVLPGNNHIQIGATVNRTSYTEMIITINFTNITPDILLLLGEQLKNLPLVLNKITMVNSNGSLTGAIILQALGDIKYGNR